MTQITALLTLVCTLPLQQNKSTPQAPNFQRAVNYAAWYDDQTQAKQPNNAYPLYAKFIPAMAGSKATDWPTFSGMFSGNDRSPIGPWDPAQYPDWEKSYQASKHLLPQLAAAAEKKTFNPPLGFSGVADNKSKLLAFVRLNYGNSIKQLTAAYLEAAWRIEEVPISTDAMLDSITVALKIASQLHTSLFVPDHKTALEIRTLAYNQIRWALAHNVIEGDNIARLRSLLKKLDNKPINVSAAFYGEQAKWYDALQYVHGPFTGGAHPQVNMQRYKHLTGVGMTATNITAMGAKLETDAAGCVNLVKSNFAKMRRAATKSYSPKQAHSISSAAEKFSSYSKLMQSLFYPVSAYPQNMYGSALKCETLRRGTRMLVELFRYHHKKDKWPSKLNEKAGDLIEDPTNGETFVYDVLDSGPFFYSMSYDGKDNGGQHDRDWKHKKDFVFWPIDGGTTVVAEAELQQIEVEGLTPIAQITESLQGQTITVRAQVDSVRSMRSRTHGRRYFVTLNDKGKTIELIYYQALADQLSERQQPQPGVTIRVEAKVIVEKEKVFLQINDPTQLTVEGQ